MADVSVGAGGIIPLGSNHGVTSQFVYVGQLLIASGLDTIGTSVATTTALLGSWNGYLSPIGIAVTSAPSGAIVYYQQPGTTLELSTLVWDGVTGQTGGLTPGAFYYMSPTVAGGITRVTPFGGTSIPIGVGVAKSETELQLQLGGAGPTSA